MCFYGKYGFFVYGARGSPAFAADRLAKIVDESEEVIKIDGAAAVEVVGCGIAGGRLTKEVDEEKEIVESDGAIAVKIAGEG